jgi:hypothetical protein
MAAAAQDLHLSTELLLMTTRCRNSSKSVLLTINLAAQTYTFTPGQCDDQHCVSHSVDYNVGATPRECWQ